MIIKIRYKEETASRFVELPIADGNAAFSSAAAGFRFAAAIALVGMILRDSPHKGQSILDSAGRSEARARIEGVIGKSSCNWRERLKL